MTITYPSGGARVEADGNGVTTTTAITFAFWTGDDLLVIHTDSSGVDTTWTYGVDFTITGGSGTTGAIVYTATDVATGEKLTILLKDEAKQSEDITAGQFDTPIYETALDKLASRVQAVSERVDRSPRLKRSTRSATPTLPEPTANLFLGWNSAGTDLENKTFAATAEDLPATASTYLKRNAGGTAWEAKTVSEVVTDLGLDWADMETDTAGQTIKEFLSNEDYGALADTSVSSIESTKYASGAAGGNTDWRSRTYRTQFSGANDATQVVGTRLALNLYHDGGGGSAPNLTFAYNLLGHIRVGLADAYDGTITTSRVVSFHTAVEGDGNVTLAENFNSGDVDFNNGTGTIAKHRGFATGDLGHATRITGEASAFFAANMTGRSSGSAKMAGFHTEMSSGAGKYAIRSVGSAQSVHSGALRLGNATADPAAENTLEVVNGFAKISSTTSYQTGNAHVIHSEENNQAALFVDQAHASAPVGIYVRYTAASPNDTGHYAFRFDDSTTRRASIASNGNFESATNSYAGTSDRRWKIDEQDAEPVLPKYRRRAWKQFHLLDDAPGTPLRRGVIAQDELRLSPELVDKTDPDKWSLNYSGLAVETGQAVSELLAIVDQLQAEVAELRAKIGGQ